MSRIDNGRVVIWGTSLTGQQTAGMALELGYEVVAYCRSTILPGQTDINGTKIIGPETLKCLWVEKKIDHVILGMKKGSSLQQVKKTIDEMFPEEISTISTDEIENEYLKEIRSHIVYRWNVDFQSQAAIWVQNYMSEIKFWVQDVAECDGRYHEGYLDRIKNNDFMGIREADDEIVKALGRDSVVMDIGCGLLSAYGTRLPNEQHITLLAVDPLAHFYDHINCKYVKGKYRAPQFGLFEFISNFYSKDLCDLILIDNALDHSIDPYKSLIECLYILKAGGKIRLSHLRAEAVNAGYQGFHRWNIDYGDQDDLIIWNSENAINVSKSLRPFCEVHIEHTEDDSPRSEQWITAYLTKTRDFQLEELIDMEKERSDLAYLVKLLMGKIADYTEDYLK